MPEVFQFFFVAVASAVALLTLHRLRVVEREQAEDRANGTADAQGLREEEALAAVGILTDEFCDRVVSPLTVILGQCELAQRRGEGDPRLERIESEARRILDAIDHQRRDPVYAGLALREIDPEPCVRRALEAAHALADRRGVNLHVMLDPMPRVPANPYLLTHALRSMLRGAIEGAAPGMGDVTFAVGLLPVDGPPTDLAFAVADDGEGMERGQFERIFQPDAQAGEVQNAIGFSYTVAWSIARTSGARLALDSAPGEGTRATLRVPLAVAAPQPPVEAAASMG